MIKTGIALAFAAVALTGCAIPMTTTTIMGADAAGIYMTKPETPPPADMTHQMPEHNSWCYRTIGETQCYAHAQDVPPERLIAVDPANVQPMDLHAYHEAVADGQ